MKSCIIRIGVHVSSVHSITVETAYSDHGYSDQPLIWIKKLRTESFLYKCCLDNLPIIFLFYFFTLLPWYTYDMYLAAVAPLLPHGNPSASGWFPEAGAACTLKSWREKESNFLSMKTVSSKLMTNCQKRANEMQQWNNKRLKQLFCILKQSIKFSK